jgi:hypothetical protein
MILLTGVCISGRPGSVRPGERIPRHLRLCAGKRGKHNPATYGYMTEPEGYECYHPSTLRAFNAHLSTFFILYVNLGIRMINPMPTIA